MIAAIYARKSTEQLVADDQKSVVRQVAHSREYALRKGWTVDEACVFVDDGISGAEFANRPGFVRLMTALRPRPSFDVLIMSEESRLGREAIETAYALKQLITAGVRVFFYLEDRERTLDSPTDKILLSLTAFADELEREKTRQRVTDAMLRKARAGHVTGCKVFGYDNVEVLDAGGRRSHVDRRINDGEAAVVRRIFGLSASGAGYVRIAKLLNAERTPAPRPKRGRPAGWSPSVVKVVLDRRMYLGELTWNRTQKRDRWGQKRLRRRHESEWIRLERPELRIIADDEWQAVHRRLCDVRARLEASGGLVIARRARDIDSPYLLSGFARCGVCGGALGVTSGSRSSARGHSYGCLMYHKRGTAICANGLKLPIGRVDDAVLRALGGDVLRPAVVFAVIDGVLEALNPVTMRNDIERLTGELQTVTREMTHLAKAVAIGGRLAPLLAELKARQFRADELRAAIDLRQASDVRRFDRDAVTTSVRARLADWRALLTSSVEDGRRLLREALVGPLRFSPTGATYRFEGEAAVGRLLVGVATNVVPVQRYAECCIAKFEGIAA